ncbi:hypothetical protein BD309DRAFT_994064 [Dichomitus squalens]|uniref:Uncharacterized protein n=1 Tax=Dichomitus squalens TaxID=114155 RepID=A0A4V2K329_9APHY|nr:hypothetical protein BD309DRAFT_994064 [Dichomitus squalens]TBU51994.1 hypothetical protein BD310DRAFT_941178 [Dichomitus squalens]
MTVPSPMRRSTARDQGYYPGINRRSVSLTMRSLKLIFTASVRCYRIETPTC